MSRARLLHTLALVAAGAVLGPRAESATFVDEASPNDAAAAFSGSKAGDERAVVGVKLCWCPAGKFTMGSPAREPERRPDEIQVKVTLTRGFWMGKYEVTQALKESGG